MRAFRRNDADPNLNPETCGNQAGTAALFVTVHIPLQQGLR
jgi:hypothetical protein